MTRLFYKADLNWPGLRSRAEADISRIHLSMPP